MRQLSQILKNSRTYTISVAEAMPRDAYQFKPVEEVWNFGELLNHIAYGIEWWEENLIKGNEISWNPPVLSLEKKDVIDCIGKAYDKLDATISTLTSSPELIKGFHATTDHVTHHRGQAVTYLRCKGIVPPEYIF